MLMTRLGGSLSVGEAYKREVDRCVLNNLDVSNCNQVVTLTGAGQGTSGPIAIL